MWKANENVFVFAANLQICCQLFQKSSKKPHLFNFHAKGNETDENVNFTCTTRELAFGIPILHEIIVVWTDVQSRVDCRQNVANFSSSMDPGSLDKLETSVNTNKLFQHETETWSTHRYSSSVSFCLGGVMTSTCTGTSHTVVFAPRLSRIARCTRTAERNHKTHISLYVKNQQDFCIASSKNVVSW